MAGIERVMGDASLIMIHNAWTYTSGDANDLRKEADDLDQITRASILAYMKYVNVDETKLKQMLDDETWLLPQDAVNMGFATRIAESENTGQASQSVKNSLLNLIKNKKITNQGEELTAAKIAEAVVERLMLNSVEPPKEPEAIPEGKKLSKFLKSLSA